MKKCSVPDCTRDAICKGLCGMHYKRHWRGGDVYAAAPRSVDEPGWTPPGDLSAAWRDRNVLRGPRAAPERPCGVEGCGGSAVAGSRFCAPHGAYRAAQRRLAARSGRGR